MMKIFVLKPTQQHKDNPLWENSIYRHPIVIRAESELLARNYAADFLMSPQQSQTPKSPWIDQHIATCELYQGDLYNREGPLQILYPIEKSITK